jgi:hypothetical protein
VSLMTRKNTSRPAAGRTRQRALHSASQWAPLARGAVPMARSAGLAAKHGAEDAVAWAAPRVKDAQLWAAPKVQEARSWAAPRVEQAGIAVRDKIGPAISDKIAPAISDALVDAAHRLDGSQTRRRRWPRLVAGFAMLAAAGSAVAAVILRRRLGSASVPFEAPVSGDSAMPAAGSTANGDGDGDEDPTANGQMPTS